MRKRHLSLFIGLVVASGAAFGQGTNSQAPAAGVEQQKDIQATAADEGRHKGVQATAADGEKGVQAPGMGIHVPALRDRTALAPWKGTAEKLQAVKNRVRDSVRKLDGRVIDLAGIKIGSVDKGETAQGIVVSQTENELDLDVDPCKNQIATFNAPYTVEKTGRTVTCGRTRYDEVSVLQQE